MSYLAATVLASYVGRYAEQKADLHEHRKSRFGALETFQNDTPNIVRADIIAAAKQAGSHATSIPVIATKDYSITTTRSCTMITNANTSALVSVSFSTVRAGFHMIPSQYGNNYVGYEDDFKRKMEDLQLAILKNLDSACLTKLNAVKSAKNDADGNPYTVVSNVMEIPNANANECFNELEAVMAANDLYAPFNVVATPRVNALLNHLIAQKEQNAVNYAYQFAGMEFRYTNRLSLSGTDYRDLLYIMPKGSCGIIFWTEPDARMNAVAGSKKWYEMELPLIGEKAAILYDEACADNSTEAGAGFEASKAEYFTVSFDYALITAYNSDTVNLPGAIFKAGILKA